MSGAGDDVVSSEQELEFDLVGYPPSIEDGSGIQMLLNVMLRGVEIDLNALVLALISEVNNVGSVLKFVDTSIGNQELSEEEEEAQETIYSITSAVNMNLKKDEAFVQAIINYIKDSADKYCADDETKGAVYEILNKFDQSLEILGFLITERMINIPADAILHELMSLQMDLTQKAEGDNRYSFTKFIRFIRMYKKDNGDMIYFNQEDSCLASLFLHTIDVPIDTEKYGTVVMPGNSALPVEYPQFRRIAFVDARDYLTKATGKLSYFLEKPDFSHLDDSEAEEDEDVE